MNFQRFNEELRTILSSLLSDGYSQKDISSITFGNNRQDQLRKFIDGTYDIGNKPLKRMLAPLNFEIHLVPIGIKSIEDREYIDKITKDTLEAVQLTMVNYLENRKKKVKKNIVFFVDTIIKEIRRTNGKKRAKLE